MKDILPELLKDLGFSAKEIKIYLALLKSGRATPANLAKATKVSRPTVYNIAKSLIAKGVALEDLGGKTLYIVPQPADNLKDLIKKEKEELQVKEKTIQKVVNELKLISADKFYPVPKIRFIEQENINDFLYKEMPLWTRDISKKDKIWWGFQDHTLVEYYEKWIHWSWTQMNPPDIEVRLLTNQSNIEEKMRGRYAKRGMKFWQGKMNFTATTWVAGDYLIMINTRQPPHYLVEIYDATLAHNMRELFRNIWNLVK